MEITLTLDHILILVALCIGNAAFIYLTHRDTKLVHKQVAFLEGILLDIAKGETEAKVNTNGELLVRKTKS